MDTCIFHSVNSGLFFWQAGTGLLVDGIHDGREQGFSPMPDFLQRQLDARTGLFAHTSGVLFTHLHRDHFQREGLLHLMRSPVSPAVYGPELPEHRARIQPVSANTRRIWMGAGEILAQTTLHDGTVFRNDPHQSFLITLGRERFLTAGDGALTGRDAAEFLRAEGGPVDGAFVNLYQLASEDGQEFLRTLAPTRIFLIHLPFREDDAYHNRSLARQVARSLPPDLPPAEILPHMAWIDGRAAQWEAREKGGAEDDLSGIAQS
ncbi:MAG: MBL fold metallo-hydrolase [Oscillospiraceae bacterium]|nr:MBL fold metallo-hydrolase [Oscillospiraceae bacterium]